MDGNWDFVLPSMISALFKDGNCDFVEVGKRMAALDITSGGRRNSNLKLRILKRKKVQNILPTWLQDIVTFCIFAV
jgi:hypothetical protein